MTRPSHLTWRRFIRHRLALGGGGLLVVFTLFALAAPLFEIWLGTGMDDIDLMNRFSGPSAAHLLGTDELGRDVFIRLLFGGRVSLFVGLSAAVFSAAIGTTVGLFAGYFGGRLDAILMRITDGIISLPLLPLLIVLAAVDMGKLGLPEIFVQSENASLFRIVLIVALFGWTTVARLVRSSALALRERPFVLAALAQGAGPARIMGVHILPNLASPIIVATTLAAGNVILLESVLSFLGLGIQPPTPSWGNLLTNAQELIWTAPGLAVYPGLLIFLTVIAFNFIGDGLQDALDPRS
ncbi:MAG TPA: ABC transporter permease, partial [Rhodospirillales bacterium]|nr:ABC transporter permease [Rhodospirillales bacterium]